MREMEITIKKIKNGDAEKLEQLARVYADVFEMGEFENPSANYFEQLAANESVLIFVAEKDGQVVGGLTSHILPSTYFQTAEVYVYDLAVKTEFQRQGIGTKLMNGIKNYCRKSNVREIFLQADTIDEHAVKFYKKIGGLPEEDVVHFSFPLKN